MNKPKITEKQKFVLEYAKVFVKTQDQFPTFSNISEVMNPKVSKSSIYSHVRALFKKGYIEKNINGKYRIKLDEK